MNQSSTGVSNRYQKIVENLQKYFVEDSEPGKTPNQFVAVFIRVGILLGIFLLLQWWLGHASLLPETSYRKAFIFFEIIKHIGLVEILAILFILFIFSSINHKMIWKSWSEFEYSDRLRLFITLIAGVLAWAYSTYGFNYYFKEEHYLDRLSLIVLAAAIYWKPGFVFPFLLLLNAVINQFAYPLGIGFGRPMDNLLIGILTIFSAAYILNGVFKVRRVNDFFFLTCCLLAAHYWWPGFGKIKLNWITHGHIYFLPLAAYAHGWLAFLEPETIIKFAKFQSWFDWPMLLATAIIEWGALFFIWRRFSVKFFLIGWITFHFAIIANTGYFFWKWMIVEIMLLLMFFRKREKESVAIFKREYFALSILLIGGIIFWFKPAALAWYDTRLSYTYRFQAVGESGTAYDLPPGFFQPYSDIFAFSDFSYITEKPQLTGPYGATASRKTADALLAATSAEQIFALEAQKKPKMIDRQKIKRFDNFFKQYFRNFNHRLGWTVWFNLWQPPPVFLTFPQGQAFQGEERIKKVIVNQITTLFTDNRLVNIRTAMIREIIIPNY